MTWWLHPIKARVKTSIKTPLGMHPIDLRMSFLRDIFVLILDFELHRNLIVFPAVQRRRVNRRRTWWLSLSQPQALRWVGGRLLVFHLPSCSPFWRREIPWSNQRNPLMLSKKSVDVIKANARNFRSKSGQVCMAVRYELETGLSKS